MFISFDLQFCTKKKMNVTFYACWSLVSTKIVCLFGRWTIENFASSNCRFVMCFLFSCFFLVFDWLAFSSNIKFIGEWLWLIFPLGSSHRFEFLCLNHKHLQTFLHFILISSSSSSNKTFVALLSATQNIRLRCFGDLGQKYTAALLWRLRPKNNNK